MALGKTLERNNNPNDPALMMLGHWGYRYNNRNDPASSTTLEIRRLATRLFSGMGIYGVLRERLARNVFSANRHLTYGSNLIVAIDSDMRSLSCAKFS